MQQQLEGDPKRVAKPKETYKLGMYVIIKDNNNPLHLCDVF